MSNFFQSPPEFKNPFLQDELLQNVLKRFLTSDQYKKVEKDLTRFGARLCDDILKMSIDVEENPPKLISFDPWGRRLDHIQTAKGWSELDQVSAQEQLISLGYQRPYQHLSRLVQFSKIFLFHPSSAFYSCPLAMTDGAAKLIECLGKPENLKKAFNHLTSDQPDQFWTSGQWMTEKSGGSDVGQSETIARFENNQWRLYGVKWFTSATTSQMAMALARIEENGQTVAGSKGLGLFYLELRDQDQKLNHIEILRLKDKLGTKGLPTAELELKGSIATLVAPKGEGVKTISHLFNVTRIYNACTSIGAMRRLLFLARDYAYKREAFGHSLKDLALHRHTLNQLEIDYQACFHLSFKVARLLGEEECPSDEKNLSKNKALLRLLTPIAKLVTAKMNMQATSELVESFGGAGYIENTGIPKYLRDAQVLCIWEGTTNVLSLDVLRAMQSEGALEIFLDDFQARLSLLKQVPENLKKQFVIFLDQIKKLKSLDAQNLQAHARELSFSIGYFTSALEMLEHAQFTKKERDQLVAQSFCQRNLCLLEVNEQRVELDKKLFS